MCQRLKDVDSEVIHEWLAREIAHVGKMKSGKLSLFSLDIFRATNVQLREDRAGRGRRHVCLRVRNIQLVSSSGIISSQTERKMRAERFVRKLIG